MLWERLPALARRLIRDAAYPAHERNARFLEHPDDWQEHESRWHQWGIITHSRMFERYYLAEVPDLLDRWGLADLVRARMSEPVGGASRDELLRAAIPLHDLGKFSVRRLILARGDSVTVSFKGHERASGDIIRSPDFSRVLVEDCDIADDRLDYVEQCARRHYVLAIVRDEAKRSGTYNLATVRGPAFAELCRRQALANPGYELEVGLLWLADSLAKVETRFDVATDEELDHKDEEIRDMLEGRGIRPGLFASARQIPVNIAVAETYLKTWAGSASPKPG